MAEEKEKELLEESIDCEDTVPIDVFSLTAEEVESQRRVARLRALLLLDYLFQQWKN